MNVEEPPPRPAVCGTCRRPLNAVNTDGVITYHHGPGPLFGAGRPEPHEPVPIYLEPGDPDMVTTCDFCGTAGAVWCYPADSFKVLFAMNARGDKIEQRSQGDWVSCQPCYEDVEASRWEDILLRYRLVAGRELDEHLVTVVSALHAGFANHRTGPAELLPAWR